MLTYPDGCILEHPQSKSSFLLYGDFDKKSFAAKGWHLEVPNLNLTTNQQKNDLWTVALFWTLFLQEMYVGLF